MPTKTCLDCGKILATWNRNWGAARCTECTRVPFAHSKAFFDKTHPTETDLQNYPVRGFVGKMLGYAAIMVAVITLAAMIGYGNARSFGGLGYGFVGAMIVIVAFRWYTGLDTIHPLDAQRWWHFAMAYSFLVTLTWAAAYMGFMPSGGSPIGGSLFSFHVRITPSFTMSAFWLVTLIAIVAALVGIALGYVNILRSDRNDKAVTLAHFKFWKQAS